MAGGFLAGVGGSFLSLFYPGSWNEGLSSGQGLMAVALVIFARWDPVRCLCASLLFGGASALGPALQSVGVTSGYYLFNAAPYALTLAIIIATSSRDRALRRAAGRAAGGEMSVAGSPTRVATVPLTRASPALEAVGVSQAFGDVRGAGRRLAARSSAGTVHALLGENGAGKSTLVKCIMGFYQRRRGPASASAACEARIASPRDAAALGIGMVYQHFTLVDNMTVAENLVLARRAATRSSSTGRRSTRRSPRSWTRCRSASIRRSRCSSWRRARSRSSRS